MNPGPYLKAVVACAGAIVASLVTGIVDGSLSTQDYLIAAGAGLTLLGIVYQTPNKP